MKRFFYFLVFLFLSFSILHAQEYLKTTEFTLDNGLKVYLNEDHSRPEVFGMVVCKTGSKNDPVDATGLAHYQEHVLFKGTQEIGTIDWDLEKPYIDTIYALYDSLSKVKDENIRASIQEHINKTSIKANEYVVPNEFSDMIKNMGGTDLNAGTSFDQTSFYNSFPPSQIEKWLEISSARFINPVFRTFQSELEVVYEEKNMYSDNFGSVLLDSFLFHFYKVHPYGQHPVIGTTEHLKNPSLIKMQEFYNTYYVANNMALIISGDFDPKTIEPIIREKFGRLPAGVLPAPKDYTEEPFKGREYCERKLSPIRLQLLGFRTIPKGHPDEMALDVCNQMLSNDNQTGLLDALTINSELLMAQIIQLNLADNGFSVIFVLPKILGQKMEDAENLVLSQLKKISSGDFDSTILESIKLQLYRNYQTSLEQFEGRCEIIANAYVNGISLDDVFDYPNKIKSLTKQDIINVAAKYYGDNYLAFYSFMGSPEKEKIDKPNYEPVVKNQEIKSEYAKKFAQIPSGDISYKFVDFNKDVEQITIKEGESLICNKNPFNDIFSLTLRYGIGNQQLPLLKYSSELMNYSGTDTLEISALKNEFSLIGCTYNISSDDSYLYIKLEGVESNLIKALQLTSNLINKPALDQSKISIIIDAEKTNRKIETSEPDNVADALYKYVIYGNMSPYINRLSIKELGALKADSIENCFRKATQYALDIFYTGTKTGDELASIISANIQTPETFIASSSPYIINPQKYSENTVYAVNKKNALQSKIYFTINGKEYNNSEDAICDAFNLYFGGDFSGLVLQEVREYRSLAYGAGAAYVFPGLQGKDTYFIGYIGTQADKTIDALDVFNSLVRQMPEKPERMEMITNYLALAALTDEPSFRDLPQTISQWKLQGYTTDPLSIKLPEYKMLNFQDIFKFYETNLKNKAMVISFVGDNSRIPVEKLQKYGKIIEIKESKLFTK